MHINLSRGSALALTLVAVAGFMSGRVAMRAAGADDRWTVAYDHLQPVTAWQGARRALAGARPILLSFDDGPTGPATTTGILAVLRKHHAHAMFFVTCQQLHGADGGFDPVKVGLLEQELAEGHQLANHSFSHRNWTQLTPEEVQADAGRCNADILRLTGQQVRYVRAPFGDVNPQVKKVLAGMHLQLVGWTASSKDRYLKTTGEIVSWVTKEAELAPAYPILMMHDRSSSLAALDAILTWLDSEGFEYVLPAGPDGTEQSAAREGLSLGS